ncbi:MAG: DUF6494 family protein [Gemmatimonadales bacterium]
MNEESFNLSIRKFLKQFGVGAQREIEHAVEEALRTGKLKGSETIPATATLRIPQLDIEFSIDSPITLG